MDFNLWSFAPRLESGWALLGELNKWVPLSTRRFYGVTDDSAGGVSAFVHGPPGEVVQVKKI